MYDHVYLFEEYGKVLESDPFSIFLEYYYYSDIITDADRSQLSEAIGYVSISTYLINEGKAWDMLKSGYKKAVDVASELPAVAKDAFEKVVDAAKSAADFAKQITSSISTAVQNVFSTVIEKMKQLLMKDSKFIGAIKEAGAKEKDNIIKDVKTMSDVSHFYMSKFVGLITQSAEKSTITALTQEAPAQGVDVKAVAESLLIPVYESGNVISTVIHFIEKYPPFSFLHGIQQIGEKGAEAVIQFISGVTGKLGGPVFTLPAIAAIIGIAIEYNIKGLAKYGILEVAGMAAFPIVTMVVKFAAYVATAIAAVMLIDETLGLGILSKNHGNAHTSAPA